MSIVGTPIHAPLLALNNLTSHFIVRQIQAHPAGGQKIVARRRVCQSRTANDGFRARVGVTVLMKIG